MHAAVEVHRQPVDALAQMVVEPQQPTQTLLRRQPRDARRPQPDEHDRRARSARRTLQQRIEEPEQPRFTATQLLEDLAVALDPTGRVEAERTLARGGAARIQVVGERDDRLREPLRVGWMVVLPVERRVDSDAGVIADELGRAAARASTRRGVRRPSPRARSWGTGRCTSCAGARRPCAQASAPRACVYGPVSSTASASPSRRIMRSVSSRPSCCERERSGDDESRVARSRAGRARASRARARRGTAGTGCRRAAA